MTLPTSQRFANSIVGQMQAGADVDIFRIDTTCKYAVGQGFTRADGNKYRYGSFGTAVNEGRLVAADFSDSGKATTDNVVINPVSTTSVASEYPTLPGQVGSHFVQATIAGITANQYQGGYLVIEDGSGEAYVYRIKGNTATGNPVAGDMRFQLWEPLKVIVSGNSDIQIIPSMYNSLIIASVGTDWAVCGVTCGNMAAGEFGWVCTHGVCAVLEDITVGTLTGGDQVALSTAVDGAVCPYGQGTTSVATLIGVQVVGYCIQTAADTEHASVYLQLE